MAKSLSEMAADDFSFGHLNAPIKPQFGYTADHAAQAIYEQLWGLIRKSSSDNLLDHREIIHSLFRMIARDSLRVRERPIDIAKDLEHIVTEWKKAC